MTKDEEKLWDELNKNLKEINDMLTSVQKTGETCRDTIKRLIKQDEKIDALDERVAYESCGCISPGFLETLIKEL